MPEDMKHPPLPDPDPHPPGAMRCKECKHTIRATPYGYRCRCDFPGGSLRCPACGEHVTWDSLVKAWACFRCMYLWPDDLQLPGTRIG